MNCTVTEEQLALFSGGDLDTPELARISAHIDECPQCRGSLADFQRTSAVLTGAFGEPDTSDLFALRAAVRSRIDRPQRPFAQRWPAAAIVAAAALVIAVLSVPHLQRREPPQAVTELHLASRALPQYRLQLNSPIPVRAANRRKSSRRPPSIEAGLRNVEVTTTPQGASELRIATADPNVLILLSMDNNPHEN